MVGGDIVANLQHQFCRQRIGEGLALGELLDVGASQHFRVGSFFQRQGSQNSGIIDKELVGHPNIQRLIDGSGIGDVAGEGCSNSSFRGDQIDLAVLGAGAAQEVPVKGS